MTPPTVDDGNYDVQFSIRVPKALADEINTRAEREGIKPSTWIRNALARTIENKDKSLAEELRAPLIRLIQEDETIRTLIRDLIQVEERPARTGREIEKELEDALKARDKAVMRVRDIEHTHRLIKSRQADMKKELERISSRQKAVLSEYMQKPEERSLVHELEKLTVTLASLKERIAVGDEELESVIHDLQEQRDELALAEAKVVSVQEELSQSFRKKEGEQLGELRRRGEGKMK
jgi:predicted DNA-binding protein